MGYTHRDKHRAHEEKKELSGVEMQIAVTRKRTSGGVREVRGVEK